MNKNIYKLLFSLLLCLSPTTTKATTSSFSSTIASSSLILLSKMIHTNPNLRQWKRKKILEKEAYILDKLISYFERNAALDNGLFLPTDIKGCIGSYVLLPEWTFPNKLNMHTGTAHDPHSFDIRGIHQVTKKRYNPDLFDQNGYYKTAYPKNKPTRYDKNGYTIDRWDKYGIHEKTGTKRDPQGYRQGTSPVNKTLLQSIEDNDMKVINIIINNPQTNINFQPPYGNNPLQKAFNRNNLPIIKLLLEYGANPDQKDNKGNRLIVLAYHMDNLELFDILFKKFKTDIRAKNDGHPYLVSNVLFDTIFYKKDLGILQEIIRCNTIDLNFLSPILDHNPPLQYAILKGRADIARMILKASSIDVNFLNKNKQTALDILAQLLYSFGTKEEQKKWLGLIEDLIAKGAKFNFYKNQYNS